MNKKKKYDVSGLTEAQFEPGSRGIILKNLVGIKGKSEMDRVETIALKQAEDFCFGQYDRSHSFTAKDICAMHKVWLGKIYPWAGTYRNINMSKGDFPFAAAVHIDQLMQEFEKTVLRPRTPCVLKQQDDIVKSLSVVHVELVLIHPFREGNGRIARLLATLMALQSGLPPLDFRCIKGKKKQEYFAAVQIGARRDYLPMEKIFQKVLLDTISGQADKK